MLHNMRGLPVGDHFFINLRSGPFLASPICSLMSSLAEIGPDQKSLKNSGRSDLADQTRDLIGC